MKNKLILLFVSLLSLNLFAQEMATPKQDAAENSSAVGLPDLLKNKKYQENQEITDTKLIAEGGSLSKYSLSVTLSYAGPTLGDFGAADQPNPDGSNGTYATSLGGSMGGRYRFSSRSTVSAGTGLKAIHPFHGMERFDTNNPYLNYTLSDKFGEIQMRNTVGYSLVTNPDYKAVGETSGLTYDFSSVYNVGSTRIAIGLDASIGYYFFNRGLSPKDRPSTSLYEVAAYPNLKYNVNDKFNINTSVAFKSFNPRKRDQSVLMNKIISERLGVGYAFTRDIYVNPYVNFYPDNLSDDGTTINISTVFSVL